MKRRPVVAALLGAVVLVSASGVAGIAWQWRRAEIERRGAVSALAQMTTARQKEEAQRQLARRAVDRMFTQVAEKWLAQQPHLEPLQRQFLEEALHFYQEFAQVQSTDPEARLETGNAYRRVGEIQEKLGDVARAEEAFRRASELLGQLEVDFASEPRYRAMLACNQHEYGCLLRKLGRLKEAADVLHESLLRRERLVAESSDRCDFRQDLARSYSARANLQMANGHNREALASYGQALSLLENLPAELASSADCRLCQASVRNERSWALAALGRDQEADQSSRQAVLLLDKLVADFPSEPGYRHALAWTLMRLGGHAREFPSLEHETMVRRALTIEGKLATDFPTVPDYKLSEAICRKFLGLLLKESGRVREAEESFSAALEVHENFDTLSPVPGYYLERADIYSQLEDLLLRNGRSREAEEVCRASIAIMEKMAASYPSVPVYRDSLALGHHRLGEALCEAGRSQEAEKAYRRALAIWTELEADSHDVGQRAWLACSHNNLAELLTTSRDEQYRDATRAVQLAKRAVELHPEPGGCWNTLGIAYYRSGDWNAAVQALEKSMELRKGGDCYDWFFLAMACWRLDHKEEARKWYKQAVSWM
jgi:tetratricopeptide (TPR) repeat protein